MSAPLTGACPVCGGERLVRHPAGLVFAHTLVCPLLAAEDATKAADHDRVRRRGTVTWHRPTTAAERTLLGALGVELPVASFTRLDHVTSSVLRRSWSGVQLDGDDAAVAS